MVQTQFILQSQIQKSLVFGDSGGRPIRINWVSISCIWNLKKPQCHIQWWWILPKFYWKIAEESMAPLRQIKPKRVIFFEEKKKNKHRVQVIHTGAKSKPFSSRRATLSLSTYTFSRASILRSSPFSLSFLLPHPPTPYLLVSLSKPQPNSREGNHLYHTREERERGIRPEMETEGHGHGHGHSTGNSIKGIPTHGGRYVQYNVYGNLFEVSSKYVPPIRPIGRGAYGIVWWVLTETCDPNWQIWQLIRKLFDITNSKK